MIRSNFIRNLGLVIFYILISYTHWLEFIGRTLKFTVLWIEFNRLTLEFKRLTLNFIGILNLLNTFIIYCFLGKMEVRLNKKC